MQHWKRSLSALTLAGLITGLALPAVAADELKPVLISAPIETAVPIMAQATWENHWAQPDTQALIDQGIIRTRKALPAPDLAMDLQEAAELLIQLRGEPVPDGDAISAAIAVGLIKPEDLDLTEFTPDTQVSREAFVAWLCRATGRQMLAEMALWYLHPEFSDADQISPRFNNAVGLLQIDEVITGYADGSFAPKQTITAAEAYRMANQALAHPLKP